ncbi:MAG: hypothetical protein J6U84_04695 [Bacteroidales bacterium]|nr:hypothetical protein [Bacteroidales bacterium]
MKKNITWIILSICVILLCLLIVFIGKFSFPSSDISDGIVTVLSAFIGILITMSITYILLNDQSQAESLKERNVKKFEKKQETYHAFLNELGLIIKNLTMRNLSGNDKTAYENINSLQELINQFSYLRIHMDNNRFLCVINKTTEIINVYKQQDLFKKYKQDNKNNSNTINQSLYDLSLSIAINLFDIAKILNEDMYGVVKSNDNTTIDQITTKTQELLTISLKYNHLTK